MSTLTQEMSKGGFKLLIIYIKVNSEAKKIEVWFYSVVAIVKSNIILFAKSTRLL